MRFSFWDMYSSVYDVTNRLAPYKALLDQVTDELKIENGHDFLDIGCGTGNLCQRLFPLASTTFGVDSSKSMLGIAKNKSGAKLCQCNLDDGLPFRHSSFDRIACIHVLYAIDEPSNIIDEIQRVLKPGGIAVIVTPRKRPNLFKIIKEHIQKVGLLSLILLLPKLLLLATFNLIIVSKGNKGRYHFFAEDELSDILGESLSITYAGQSWIVTKGGETLGHHSTSPVSD